VQNNPHAVALVEADLEEVVPAAEGAELLERGCDLLVGQVGVRTVRYPR
jgi:hypothetical protein